MNNVSQNFIIMDSVSQNFSVMDSVSQNFSVVDIVSQNFISMDSVSQNFSIMNSVSQIFSIMDGVSQNLSIIDSESQNCVIPPILGEQVYSPQNLAKPERLYRNLLHPNFDDKPFAILSIHPTPQAIPCRLPATLFFALPEKSNRGRLLPDLPLTLYGLQTLTPNFVFPCITILKRTMHTQTTPRFSVVSVGVSLNPSPCTYFHLSGEARTTKRIATEQIMLLPYVGSIAQSV